jgi:2-dehydro-3-deoxyphosphogluconate aldolase / (4S)-4-hydroxy-2-oxoglutarate aldolase
MTPEGLAVGSTPLLAIVRFPEGGDVPGAVDALVRGGVEALEITIDTPGALAAVERAAEAGLTVGVGTVLSADQVRASADAGARFVVSPGIVFEVVDAAHAVGIEPMPGVFTATEILEATTAGARVMKLFPAMCGGPGYLHALRGPFPRTALVPTGGVRVDEIGAYLEAGATAVALGSELVGRAAPRSDRDREWIAAQASRAVAAAASARADVAPGGPTAGEDGGTPGPRVPADAGARH